MLSDVDTSRTNRINEDGSNTPRHSHLNAVVVEFVVAVDALESQVRCPAVEVLVETESVHLALVETK